MAPRLKVTQTAAGGRQTITSLYSCLLPRLEHSCHFPLLIITIMNIRCLWLSRRGGGTVAHPLQLQHSHLVHEVPPPLLQTLHVGVLVQILHHALSRHVTSRHVLVAGAAGNAHAPHHAAPASPRLPCPASLQYPLHTASLPTRIASRKMQCC